MFLEFNIRFIIIIIIIIIITTTTTIIIIITIIVIALAECTNMRGAVPSLHADGRTTATVDRMAAFTDP
jgi:hypothetical protein